MHREERIHFATNYSKSAHIWTCQNFAVFTGYNVASVAAGNATIKKYTLWGYFHHYYVFLFIFDGPAIRGYSQKIRGYSLECPGLTPRLMSSLKRSPGLQEEQKYC
jgi:hypothetical protein